MRNDNSTFKYTPYDDYCQTAKDWQSIPDHDTYRLQYPKIAEKDIDTERAKIAFSCEDYYHMATVQDNQIFIGTADWQHDQIQKVDELSQKNLSGTLTDDDVKQLHAEASQLNLSGYFTDQATVDACTASRLTINSF